MFKNCIAGEWIGSEGRENINPSDTDDVIGVFAKATREDVLDAISAAKAAFPAWSRSGPLVRHAVLRKAADEILARKDELGALLAREEGKTLPEAVGEVVRASQIFDFFAGEALRLAGETVPSVRPGIAVDVTREPLGVIGIITPWNFPIAIPAWKIAPALCYGNTVVFKPADLVPASSWAIVDILQRAGLPAGVLNLVMGRGSLVGQAAFVCSRIAFHSQGRSSRRRVWGMSLMRASTSASHAWGSTSLSFAVVIRPYMIAARWPPRSEPQKSHAFLPMAIARPLCPCRAGC